MAVRVFLTCLICHVFNELLHLQDWCYSILIFRYEKACMGASDFGVLQLGICVAIKVCQVSYSYIH
mgnify:CR=1 FL=1